MLDSIHVDLKRVIEVFRGKFQPLNLMKLCPNLLATHDGTRPGVLLLSTDGAISTSKPTGAMKEFGNPPTRRMAAFPIYSAMMIIAHHNRSAKLGGGLSKFANTVAVLALTYGWQQVLQFAIKKHEQIGNKGDGILGNWEVTGTDTDYYCHRDRSSSNTRPHNDQSAAQSPPSKRLSCGSRQKCFRFNKLSRTATNRSYEHTLALGVIITEGMRGDV